jgi:hypothetical protein
MPRTDFTSQYYLRNPAKGLEKMRAAGPVVEVRLPIIGEAVPARTRCPVGEEPTREENLCISWAPSSRFYRRQRSPSPMPPAAGA